MTNAGRSTNEWKVKNPSRSVRRLVARMIHICRPFWLGILVSAGVAVLVALSTLAIPLVTQELVDAVYVRREFHLVQMLALTLFAAAATTAVASGLRGMVTVRLNIRMGLALTHEFMSKIYRLPLRHFDGRTLGEVTTRLQDLRVSLVTVTRVTEVILLNTVYMLIIPPTLLTLSAPLALIVLLMLPVGVLVAYIGGKYARRRSRIAADNRGVVASAYAESLGMMQDVKSLRLESVLLARTGDVQRSAAASEVDAAVVAQLTNVASGLIRALGLAAMTWYGWGYIRSGELTLGGYLAFTAFAALLSAPMAQLAGLFSELQQAAASLERMFEYFDLPGEQRDAIATTSAQRRYGPVDVACKSLRFAYVPACPVLRDVSLVGNAGELVAIVGGNGSGKTSLLRILAGLDTAEGGSIALGGQDTGEMTLHDVRTTAVLVSAESQLFRASVLYNLTVGISAPSMSRLNRVIDLCLVRHLVDRETERQQQGDSQPLSAGERQRVAIARALMRCPAVLLLDEATAQIDDVTVTHILGALRTSRDSTIIVATHQQSVIDMCDRVYQLVNGVAVEGRRPQVRQPADAAFRTLTH